MLLSNLLSLQEEQKVDIVSENDKISSVSGHDDSSIAPFHGPTIRFNDALVFPGLINSHDHLDFNLFPQLGNRIYNNYVEWGEDIHKKNKDIIDKVLKIPKQLRIQWGIYKNLLNGVTTVINHGTKLQVKNNLITIWQNTHSLHSVQLEKRWRYKLNMPFIKNHPFSIHIGEGTNETSHEEIDRLIKWNLFKNDLIGIHAVAMDEEQAVKFKAIVWCPDSNHFLLGQTAAIDKLKNKTKILFGTDSTVSSNWNLWEHLRLARQEKMVTDNELFSMMNTASADIWSMPGHGKLAKGYTADIVIAKRKQGLKGMDAFFALNPEDILMVLHQGNIRLFDEDLYTQLNTQGVPLQNFYKIKNNTTYKYISGNLPDLIKSIESYYPEVCFPVA